MLVDSFCKLHSIEEEDYNPYWPTWIKYNYIYKSSDFDFEIKENLLQSSSSSKHVNCSNISNN